jgi:hypothetical protein
MPRRPDTHNEDEAKARGVEHHRDPARTLSKGLGKNGMRASKKRPNPVR